METTGPPLSGNFAPPSQSIGPSCGDTQCNNRGTCVPSPDGGDPLCVCQLGYTGDTCERTYNGAMSVPLTLSILGVILGLVILAFVLAKLRRRRKKKSWRNDQQ